MIKPTTAKEMVFSALSALDDKKGSTIPAIKKYMRDTYNPSEMRLKNVTKIVSTGVKDETIIQTMGMGCSSGSRFKLPPQKPKKKPEEEVSSLKKKIADVAKLKVKETKKEPTKRKAKDSNISNKAK